MSIFSSAMPGLLAPALCAGLAVAAIHVPLGREVLKRGVIFIDLAIAQIAALGVAVGGALFHAEDGLWPPLLALLFAFGGSGVFAWLEKKAPRYQEAFIGCAFVLAASLALIVLAGDPHGGEKVESLLAGQILWVGWAQVGLAAIIYAPCLAAWFFLPRHRAALFYILFPLAVTVAVQMVGVYLVFASLILPALGSACFSEKRALAAGYAIAVAALCGGLMVAVMADLPAGPALVWGFALAAFGAFGVSLQR